MTFAVTKGSKGWAVTNITTNTRIGFYAKRSEAVLCARMLAGWRGVVVA